MTIITGLLDFGLLLTTTIWLGVVHVRGFALEELSPSIFSSSFYTYARRLPISEHKLFRSRMLVKGVQVPLFTVVGIFLAILLEAILNNNQLFPFFVSDLSFYSFLSLWAAIAFVATQVALDEIGVRYQNRVRQNSHASLLIFLLFLLYLIVWVWLVPFDDTFMTFTVFLAAEFPLLSFLIALLITFITTIIVLWTGDRRINRKGDANGASD